MTVQSVGSVTAKFNAVSNQAVPNAATDSFVKVYDNSKINNNGQTARNQSRLDKKNIDSLKDASAKTDKPATKTVDDSNIAENPIWNEKINAETDSITPIVESDVPDAETLEDALATLATLLNQITDLLKQFLNVNEEQLANAANELSLEPMDLLSEDGIKNLFLELNNASPEDLLTDEQLLSNLSDLQNAIEQVTDELLPDNTAFEKLSEMIEAGNTEELLQNPMFKEVFNEYLATGHAEEIPEDEVKVEIKDLRSKDDAINPNAGKAEENVEETQLKPVTEKDDSSKRQTSSEKHEFVTPNDFAVKIAKVIDEMESAEPARLNTFRDLYNITGQVIDKIKLTLTSDASSMEIQLHPEHLGKVDLQISSKNGIMSAELTAHSESAKRALEAGLEDLKVSLEQTGLRIENVEVTLAEFGFRQRDDREQGEGRGEGHRGRRRNIGSIADDNNLQKDFETVSDIMKELNGNSVDYTA